MLPTSRISRLAPVLVAMTLLVNANPALTANLSYIGPNNGSWQNGLFWAPVNPLAPVFPGFGDSATVATTLDTRLNANVQGLSGLAIANNSRVVTSGHQLTVINLANTAETNITGTGVAGGDTMLQISNAPTLYDFIGDRVNIGGGGYLRLEPNSQVRINHRVNVDGDSFITGAGQFAFNDGPTNWRMRMAGTIRPDANRLLRFDVPSGEVDLDGISGTGLLDMSASGSRIAINATLDDAFSGTMLLGSGSRFSISTPWQYGTASANAGTRRIRFQPGDGNEATIAGLTPAASLLVGGVDTNGDVLQDANIQALNGTGVIDMNVEFRGATDMVISTGARLDLTSEVRFRGGSFTGGGILDVGTMNYVMDPTTISVGAIDMDSGDWQITDHLQLDVGRVDGYPNNLFENRTIDLVSAGIGADGRMTVNLPDGDAWTLRSSAAMNISGETNGFTTTHVDGSRFEIEGPVNISGASRFGAPVTLGETGGVHLASSGSSWTLASDSQLDGGVIDGAGSFRSTSAEVTGHGAIDADVAFSASASLLARGGTLRISGNIDSLGALFGTADATGTLRVEDTQWDIASAGSVRLNGGALIDGAVSTFVQNNGGLLQGHGLVSVNSLNNNGQIVASDGLLVLDGRVDWDGSPGGGNEGDGSLSAVKGDLLFSHSMHQGPSFVGQIEVARGRTFTYETGGEDDDILFDDPTGDGDAVQLDRGRLAMAGGRLIADRVTNEGRFTIDEYPSSIHAGEILFNSLGETAIASELRLNTQGGFGSLIDAGAEFSGAGKLTNAEESLLIVQDNAEVGVHLVNEGDLVIGAGPFVSTISARIEVRSFEQSTDGNVIFEIGGTALGDFDQIDAAEGVSLAGRITAALDDGFAPSLGDAFTIISTGGGGVSGEFDFATLPVFDGLTFGLVYHDQSVELQVVELLPGDYNQDGMVDAADYTRWRDAVGLPEGALPNDVDGGPIGDAQYLTWRANYGASSAGAALATAAAPEPASLLLGLIAIGMWGRRRG